MKKNKYKAIGFDYNGVISDGHFIDYQILKLVDKLRANGYKLGLLSNFGHSGAERIRELGITEHFDAFHASGETGYAKPQPEAFINLAKELGVAVTELVYIDDSPYSLSNAEKTGFYPILYTGFGELQVELGSLGIKH